MFEIQLWFALLKAFVLFLLNCFFLSNGMARRLFNFWYISVSANFLFEQIPP